jgi:hypothetical protein
MAASGTGGAVVNEWSDEQWLVARDWRIDIDVWVKDIATAAAAFSERFGLGPWKYSRLRAPLVRDVCFRGEPAVIDLVAAISDIGPLGIELLEVRGGSDAVRAWAAEMPDGDWHPVAYHATVAEAEAAFAEFEKRGFAPVLSGWIAGSRFYMLDASALLGRMFEVAGGPLETIEWTSTPI